MAQTRNNYSITFEMTPGTVDADMLLTRISPAAVERHLAWYRAWRPDDRQYDLQATITLGHQLVDTPGVTHVKVWNDTTKQALSTDLI